jgi:hypothetical protein
MHVASPPAPNESLAIPLGSLTGAALRLRFGGGELNVHPAAPGMLVAGWFEGGVVYRWTGPGSLELEPLSPGRPLVTWRPTRWDVGVTAQIPVDLRLETGANRSTVDLGWLRIRRLELHTGASESTLKLPAGGQVAVRVVCGMAGVRLEVPPSVSARIQGRLALGSVKVDEARFPRGASGWSSPDFEAAQHRVDITIEGGLGSVKVT